MKRTLFFSALAAAALTIILFLFFHFSTSNSVSTSEPYEVTQARSKATIAQLERDQHSADFWLLFGQALAITLVVTVTGLLVFICWQFYQSQTHRRDMERARLKRYSADLQGNFDQYFDPDQGITFTPPPGNYIQPVPQHYSFAPHYSPPGRGLEGPAGAVAQLAAPVVMEELPAGPIDLADLSFKPTSEKILLAIGPGGKLITTPVKYLCHVALAGATGGGKSNAMRLLIPQLQAVGARVALADPHYTSYDVESGDDWRAIEARLTLRPAVKASDIEDLLKWLALDELPRRLEMRREQKPVGQPFFLAIDELPAIVADVPGAQDYMGRLLREGRKVQLLLLTAAQDWLVKTVGGTGAVRDNFRTAVYVGGDPTTARVLLDIQGKVDDGQLGAGLAMLRSRATPTAQTVRLPLASNASIEQLLSLPATTGAATNYYPAADSGSEAVVTTEATEYSPLPADSKATDARSERVLQMLRDRRPQNEIIAEIWQVKSAGGRAYTRAAEELREIIAGLI